MIGKNRIFLAFMVAFTFLSGNSAAQDGEYRKLLDEQKALSGKIQALKAEQDFLLFLKVLSTSDSKYLILNMSAGKGQLRYKNRILRDYPLIAATRSSALIQGAATLTKKIEGPRQKHALVFGKTVILQPKGAAAYREAGIRRLTLPKKDFMALYYGLENGAFAYILP